VVRILGFESLLEAGGVIGFIGVLLALTQGAWAPDIISGLIILNSRLMEEGDVVEFWDGTDKIIGIVFKTKVFHTEILDLADNHRTMVQNSRLRTITINNLSKFASAKGLREELRFNIGYDVPESKVQGLFLAAFDAAIQDSEIAIEASHPPQTSNSRRKNLFL
jgi:small-conductance mechanosensitive channel